MSTAKKSKAAMVQAKKDRLFEEGTVLLEEGIMVLEEYVDRHQQRSTLGAALRLLKLADKAFLASCESGKVTL